MNQQYFEVLEAVLVASGEAARPDAVGHAISLIDDLERRGDLTADDAMHWRIRLLSAPDRGGRLVSALRPIPDESVEFVDGASILQRAGSYELLSVEVFSSFVALRWLLHGGEDPEDRAPVAADGDTTLFEAQTVASALGPDIWRCESTYLTPDAPAAVRNLTFRCDSQVIRVSPE